MHGQQNIKILNKNSPNIMKFHSKALGKERLLMFPKTGPAMETVSATAGSSCLCRTKSPNVTVSATWLWELQISQH